AIQQRDRKWHVSKNGLTMIVVSAGTFVMGSSDSDVMAYLNERPTHQVTISSFSFAQHEVTQELYQKIMGDNPSFDKGDATQPVTDVLWLDAIRFCNKLSVKENLEPYYTEDGEIVSIFGNGYRLPTESEWEYACRAGTTTPWSFGGDESHLGDYAWNRSNSGYKPHPVGEKKPNPWGLHDMQGNVWEWCWDWYGKYKPGSSKDPLGPENGIERLLRGGSFPDPSLVVRSAARNNYRPSLQSIHFGFRPSRTYP
ncbi:MAG: formylglycine-generating enzyme family protein, partial [Planctomycetes bacterium]|nr:formylglycine-generating enzyme family protein [Planctomycetota bacterium]